jgi:hypothetical protein
MGSWQQNMTYRSLERSRRRETGIGKRNGEIEGERGEKWGGQEIEPLC